MSGRSLSKGLTAFLALVVAGATAHEPGDARLSTEGMTFLGGDGEDPFGLVAVGACSEPGLPRGGELYWGGLDLTPDRSELFGVVWDELWWIDPVDGSADRWGRIAWGTGKRTWFSGPSVAGTSALNGAYVYVYYLRATISFEDSAGGLTYEETVEALDALLMPLSETVIVDELVEYQPPDGPMRSVRVVVTLDMWGLVDIELADLQGPDAAFVHGVFTAMTPGATNGEPIPLPVTSLALSPSGQMVVLTDAEWDPEGRASLYDIQPDGDEVIAVWMSELDVDDVWAIEFADNGTLYGAGQRLYTITPGTGATTLIADLASATIVDLDYAPDGRLYGVHFTTNGPPVLYDLTPGDVQTDPVAYLAGGPFWGFAVLPRDIADLDGDGDVDADDQAIYDAEYTGSLTGPFVPPGPGGPALLDPLPVPMAAGVYDHCSPAAYKVERDCVWDAAVYSIDALDTVFPGIVVDGTTTGLDDTSVTIYVKHEGDWLHVAVEVLDDDVISDSPGYDVVELYLDSNNSDLPVTEGDAFGFQATMDAAGSKGGDAPAWPAWQGQAWVNYRPGYRVWFSVDKSDTGMITGDTYGFDLAVKDIDGEPPVDVTHYFLFSVDSNGWRDETQWGDIYLAPGPLPDRATDPHPVQWDVLVDANTNLGWTPAPDAAAHRVYLGDEPDDLVFQGEQVGTTFDPGPLSKGWTYYWRIDEVNSNGAQTGAVWAFTTAHSPADIDRDGDVDEYDLRRLAQRPAGDLSGDEVVTYVDLVLFLASLGSMVGDPAYDPGADYDDDGEISPADQDIWKCHYMAFWEDHIGDLDLDGDVDLDDYAAFAGCWTGPTVPVTPCCYDADLTFDERVDLLDAAELQRVFTGP